MRIFRNGALAILLVAGGFVLGRYEEGRPILAPTVHAPTNNQFTFSPFQEAWDTLHANFINPLDDKTLSYGAVEGMVSAAGDPYTAFSTPEQTKQFEESLRGSFSGIGAEMGIKNGIIIVIAPLEGSPAQKAGVQAQDAIVAVNKKNITDDMSLDEVVRMIRGPRGESVLLTVIHPGAKETTDISVVRDNIHVPSAKLEMKDGVAHISISSFNGDTAAQFARIAREAKRQNPKGIVLDVRNNPGGYLDEAVAIASQFLDPGMPVVTEKGKTEKTHYSKGEGILKGIPVVVLVNQGSASASEIVAGALQDNLQAKIIGKKTYGKGSVQDIIEISDGSSLRVTIAKWFTPSGKSINEHGIDPTVGVEDDTSKDGDEQFIKAVEELTK